MTNEEKILEMLTKMQADIDALKKNQMCKTKKRPNSTRRVKKL